jgi:transposase
MNQSKRRRFSAEFKAKVALEALRGEQTLSELATRFDLHPNMIAQWKRQATEGMVEVFSSKSAQREEVGEAQIKDLHAKIGQLTIERDFLAKASGR